MILQEISQNVQRGKAPLVKELVQTALDQTIDPQAILDEALLGAMEVVGEKFKNNQVFVPEVLIAARALNAGLEILKPHMIESASSHKGTIVLGTVKGDLHDIGKNLVKIMMEGKGINVVDIGIDVPAEKFIDAAKEHNASLICCSALLTTTMDQLEIVVEERKKVSDFADTVKVMIGGAPVTQEYCDRISADFYAPDAASAAEVAMNYLNSIR